MTKGFGFIVAACMIAAPIVAFGHHSFAAEFDSNKKITLTGSVTKVDWLNPHIWVYLDVKNSAGQVEHWQCEGGPPNTLTRNGWTKNAVQTGHEITIDGTRAKDASNTCNATSVKLADGRRVLAGSSQDLEKQ